MKSEIAIKTNKRLEMIPITHYVLDFIEKEKIKDGLVTVFIPHTTAAVTINENCDPDVPEDLNKVIKTLIPSGINFRHGEGNSDAHFMSSLVGVSLTLIVEKGQLLLGTWQGLYFWEFDGPRHRKFFICHF